MGSLVQYAQYNSTLKRMEYYSPMGQLIRYEESNPVLDQTESRTPLGKMQFYRRYNDVLHREEIYDSMGHLLAYSTHNKTLGRVEYYDNSGTSIGFSDYNSLLSRTEYHRDNSTEDSSPDYEPYYQDHYQSTPIGYSSTPKTYSNDNGETLTRAVSLIVRSIAQDRQKRAQRQQQQIVKLMDDAASLVEKGEYAAAAKKLEKYKEKTGASGQTYYYLGFCYKMAGNRKKSIDNYLNAKSLSYYADGSVFHLLSDLYLAEGDTLKGKMILEEGFSKYPQSQSIVIGLVNLYRSTNEDPLRLPFLLHIAQQNEPNNASLYYVEGDVYKQLGDRENAERLFYKATEIDPTYVFGPLSVGIMYYEYAVELQALAVKEPDDYKWYALITQFEASLEKAIDPFEKSFTMTEDKEIKKAVAEYLKNIYFRFRDKSPEYMAAYHKYNTFLESLD